MSRTARSGQGVVELATASRQRRDRKAARRAGRPGRRRTRFLAVEPLERRLVLSGTEYMVDSLADVIAEDGAITLREALEAANTNAAVNEAPAGSDTEADLIQFAPALTGGTIALELGQLTISGDLDIQGLGADRLTIDAQEASRVLEIAGGITASLSGLRITGGNADEGGGIRNWGTATLSGLVVTGNQAGNGAAIDQLGPQLTIIQTAITANVATGWGGIYNRSGTGVTIIRDSLLSDNSVQGGGGALHNESGDTTFINATLSGNTAAYLGGAVYVGSGSVRFVQATITGNQTDSEGGGVYRSGGTVRLDNTIVAGNRAAGAGQDIRGEFDAAGDYNLIGIIEDSAGLDTAHTQYGHRYAPLDAMLGPLADNGGPTLTHRLWQGSPAVDAGDNDRALDELGAALVTDQRGTGFPRIVNGTVDVGAVEGPRAVEFALTGPAGGYQIGQTAPFTWDPAAVPVASQVSLFYDTDALTNGNETWVVLDLPAPLDGRYDWQGLVPQAGDYYVGGVLRAPDGTEYTSRLAGAVNFSVGGTLYTVDSDDDVVAVDGVLTLREAVMASVSNAAVGDAPAGSDVASDLIQFAPALTGGRIVLNGSALSITDDLIITGPGAAALEINGDERSRLFAVTDPTPGDDDPVRVSIAGLTLANGKSATDGGGVYNEGELQLASVTVRDNAADDDGGGVFNAGWLLVTDATIAQNTTNGSSNPSGGGIYNQGTLTMQRVQILQNVAYDDGGGVATNTGSLVGTDLVFAENTAFDGGGGLYCLSGTLRLSDGQFTQNTAHGGGGGMRIDEGAPDLRRLTVAGNFAVSSEGGGILMVGNADWTLADSALQDNSARDGGGLYTNGTGHLWIGNSTLADNTATGTGGGLVRENGWLEMVGSSLIGNSAVSGGGGYLGSTTSLVRDTAIQRNRAQGGGAYGGGLDVWSGSLTMERCDVSGNVADGTSEAYGGGLRSYYTTVRLSDTTISGNEVWSRNTGAGGGLGLWSNDVTLTRTTVSGNSVFGALTSRGGGVFSHSWLNVINATVSGNRAFGSALAAGGGIYQYDYFLNVTQSTVTLNDAGYGGGIEVNPYAVDDGVRLTNSIVAGNTAWFEGPDVRGTFHSDSHADVIGIIDGSLGLDDDPSILFGTAAAPLDALVGSLADNGGYTLTHALLGGSPALDLGDNTVAAGLGIDQRYAARIQNGTVDIGSVEGSIPAVFNFSGPTGTISAGAWQTLSWTQASLPATNHVTIFADPDSNPATPNDVALMEDADPNALGGQWSWAAVDLPAGTYTLGATVTNWLTGEQATRRLPDPTTVVYDQAYMVDSLADVVAADGVVTLREAVQAANLNQVVGDAHAGRSEAVDVIVFAPALAGGEIELSQGQIAITDGLAIRGLGEDVLTIAGTNTQRLFQVQPGVDVWLTGLRLRDGYSDTDGGAVWNAGQLVVTDCTLEANLAYDDGGAMYNDAAGRLELRGTTLIANATQGSGSPDGGGLFNLGRVMLVDSAVLQNTASGQGGGIWSTRQAELDRVSIRQNTAFGYGGGLWIHESVTITAATIQQNLAFGDGGGLAVFTGAAMVTNSLFLDNAAANGGGVWGTSSSLLLLDGTQVEDNSASSNGGGVCNLSGLTRVRASSVSSNSAGYVGGGMYFEYGTSVIDEQSTINGNQARGSNVYGGGINVYGGSLTVDRSEIRNNVAEGSGTAQGGGLRVYGAYLTLHDTLVSGNRVSGATTGVGGGMSLESSVVALWRSTISDNSVYGGSTSQGGGLYSNSQLDVIDGTISGNRVFGSAAAGGGGIYQWDNYLTLILSTVTLNEAAYGGGIQVHPNAVNDGVRLKNSIVAGNAAWFEGPDVYGEFHPDSASCLIGIIDASVGLAENPSMLYGIAAEPLSARLGALADNGGATPTHALLAGSPAVDAGDNTLTVDPWGQPITIDQRGALRIQGGRVDMGAYEGPGLAESFELSGPTGTIQAGQRQTISWTNSTITATSLLTLYADPDGVVNGNEIKLLQDADPNALGGSWTWYAVDVPEGCYTLGGYVVDRVDQHALTDRLDALTCVSYAGAYVVDSLADVVAVDGMLTLREALAAANTNTAVGDAFAGRDDAVDIIHFDSDLAGGVIRLVDGELSVTDDVAIQWLHAQSLTVTTDSQDRLVSVAEDVLAWIRGLTLTGGHTNGDGGGLWNGGTLSLQDVTVTGNTAFDDGGGIFNSATGELSVAGSRITFNSASGSASADGGGLGNEGIATLSGTMIDGNAAGRYGGGVGSTGTLSTGDGTIVQNNEAADSGGGLALDYYAVLRDSTIQVNRAVQDGGGVAVFTGASSLIGTTVEHNEAGRDGGGVFDVSGGSLLIEDTSVSHNAAVRDGGGVWDYYGATRVLAATLAENTASRGGGIGSYSASLAIDDSAITGNRVRGWNAEGGGVWAASTTTINRSRISGNVADGSNSAAGGGIRAQWYGLSVTDSTVADNQVLNGASWVGGGGIYSDVSASITRSTISGNAAHSQYLGATYGGGIYSGWTLYVTNSTISGNEASQASTERGGGIYKHDGTLVLTNSTVTLNVAAEGGGVDVQPYAVDDGIYVRNSIVAGNTAVAAGPDVRGDFNPASAYNVIGIVDGSTGLTDDGHTQFGTAAFPLSARLGTLADHGGPTLTHALLTGSPAVDAGSNALALDEANRPLTTDQRGGTHFRILDGVVDVGAYEGKADLYFALTAPTGGTVSAGWATPIRWAGNVPTTSLISVYLDTDSTLNGNEGYLLRDQPYAPLDGQYLWESIAAPEGTYQIGAVVTDSLSGYWAEDRTPEFELIHEGVPTLYLVNTTADVVAADGVLSLREALQAANTNTAVNEAPAGDPVEQDVIRFDPALVGRTIALTAPLAITNHVRIEGVGAGEYRITLDAQSTGVVFSVAEDTNVGLSSLRLTGGAGSGAGGAIANAGTLELQDVEIFGNRAPHGGGLANSGGDVTATRVWIHDNQTTAGDGRGGGASTQWGTVRLLDSAVTGNAAVMGGGVYVGWYGQLLASNSTVSGNSASGTNAVGGGLVNTARGSTRLTNVTVAANAASGPSSQAGGAFLDDGTFYLVNTIIAGNTATENTDVWGAFDPAGDYNLIGVVDGSTGLEGLHTLWGTAAAPLDALLAALADNGGPTPTHAIQSGSPAINAGLDAAAVDLGGTPLAYDQRGALHSRILPLPGRVDVGAFEYNPDPSENQAPTIGGLVDVPDPVTAGGALTLTVTGVTDDHGVAAVRFYRDANRDGTGTPDELIGVDVDGGDGWRWTGAVTWPLGQTDYLAQVTDDGWPVGVKTSGFARATGTTVAATRPVINVGTHELLAGQTGQRIQINVTGADKVTGFNLYAQIGDGRGVGAEPVFEAVEFGGGIWDAHPTAITGGVVSGAEQLAVASVVFSNPGDETLANGLLVTLVVNTSGFTAGQTFDLKVRIDESDLNSQFLVYGGHTLAAELIAGTIELYEAEVVGRHVFYNESHFDGDNAAANAADDAAIAPDKTALRAGQTATFANYTSYWRGINGVMIDIKGLSNPSALGLGDFEFRVGNNSNPASWVAGPSPVNDIGAGVRLGAGVDGSDRVTLIWDALAVKGQWLQITVKQTVATGLAGNDVFYFGNAPGECGNSTSNAYVDGTDFAGPRDNPRNFLDPAALNFPYDYNRDSFVDGTDMAIARDNHTHFLTDLELITVPAGGKKVGGGEGEAAVWNGGTWGAAGVWGDGGRNNPLPEGEATAEPAAGREQFFTALGRDAERLAAEDSPQVSEQAESWEDLAAWLADAKQTAGLDALLGAREGGKGMEGRGMK